MEEFLLKNRKVILAGLTCLIASVLVFVSIIGGGYDYLTQRAEAQTTTSTDITVTAIVEAWLSFEVSTTTLDITPPLVTADGTFNIGSTIDIGLSLGTNAENGWDIDIRGLRDGLYSTTTDHTIDSVSGTGVLVDTGVEGYGANATSTMTGATIGALYNSYGTDTVGEIITTDRQLATKATPNLAELVANMQVKAAAANDTPPAFDYSDTITLTATANL